MIEWLFCPGKCDQGHYLPSIPIWIIVFDKKRRNSTSYMKTLLPNFFFGLLGLLFSSTLIGQVDAPPRFYSEECEEMSNPQDRMECAQQAMMSRLYKNLKKPEAAIAAEFNGNVVLSFWINEKGFVERVKVLTDPGYGCADAAVFVLEEYLYAWVPAMVNGEPTPIQMTLPIRF